MNLKEWVVIQGVSYSTVLRWHKGGVLPVPTYQVGRLVVIGDGCRFSNLRHDRRLRRGVLRRSTSRPGPPAGSTTSSRLLLLSERTYVCAVCGLVKDRDENAAANLAEYGARMIAESGSEIENGRGADRKTGPARQVATKLGAPPACGGQPGGAASAMRQTGTVRSQERTVA
jgi:hypothetical protein